MGKGLASEWSNCKASEEFPPVDLRLWPAKMGMKINVSHASLSSVVQCVVVAVGVPSTIVSPERQVTRRVLLQIVVQQPQRWLIYLGLKLELPWMIWTPRGFGKLSWWEEFGDAITAIKSSWMDANIGNCLPHVNSNMV